MGKEVNFNNFEALFKPTENGGETAASITGVDIGANSLGVAFSNNYSDEVVIEISTDNVTFAFYGKTTLEGTIPFSGSATVDSFTPTLTDSMEKYIRAKVENQDGGAVYSASIQIVE